MPHPEVPSSSPLSPLSQGKIAGFEGFEMMREKVDVLQEGTFAQFMRKVLEYRSNPSKMEALRKEFAGYEKKRDIAALRAGGLSDDPIEGPARLFAFFGKEVGFEGDGIRVKFDFHGMNVAKSCIGAGHLFPGNVARIQNKKGEISERRPGPRGPEYRFLKGRRYQAIYTNTEIFIHYRDIFPDSVDDLRERAEIEGKFVDRHVQLRAETRKGFADIVPAGGSAVPGGPAVLGPAPGPASALVPAFASGPASAPTPALVSSQTSPESHEVYRPSDILVFGDSQIGGMRGYLMKGVRSYHRNGGVISQIRHIASQHRAQVENAKLIYVQAGGNDVWSANFEKMKTEMQKLVAYIRDINPSVRLVVGTIPPREEAIVQKSSARAKEIRQCLDEYNEWVRSNYEVFDVNRIMASAPGSSYQNPEYRRKGAPDVHFNTAGYKAYAQAFERQFSIGGSMSVDNV